MSQRFFRYSEIRLDIVGRHSTSGHVYLLEMMVKTPLQLHRLRESSWKSGYVAKKAENSNWTILHDRHSGMITISFVTYNVRHKSCAKEMSQSLLSSLEFFHIHTRILLTISERLLE
mmetsp:Transcript_836/g.1258  ORF Transcript_836/g.1258 Transcript_836/m.1258 type:complete len:117 (-) Transcript_836:1918-2268(-)